MKSNYELIKEDIGNKYWLGQVIQIVQLAEYGFVEYHPYVSISEKQKGFQASFSYSVYINGKSIGISCDNLDQAILTAIAHKYDGANSQAPYYFSRMLGIS